MAYKKLYSECGYSQNALTSDQHFLSPNNPNYYLKKYYEPISNIQQLDFHSPHELKFGTNNCGSDNPFENKSVYRFEKSKPKCKSCSGGPFRENFTKIPINACSLSSPSPSSRRPGQGWGRTGVGGICNQEYKPGSKTVPNCTNCYSGEGKHAIPVTPIDTHDVRMVKDIYNDPKACNVNWNKSRYNLIEGYESFEKILNKNENGLSKSLWGPRTWDVLHAMSFAFPHNPTMKQKVDAWNLFNSLPTLLPCKMCSGHCDAFIKKNPPDVENRHKLSRWLWKFHNAVNHRLGKDKYSWDKLESRYKNKNSCK